MKFKTLVGLLTSGQLFLLLRLNPIFRQTYRSSFIAAALSERIYTLLRDRPASLDTIYQQVIGSSSGENLAKEKFKTWLDVGVMLGELKQTPAGYALRSRLARQLAQPSNDGIAAMYQEVCTLHHDLILQTPARLRENRAFAPTETDGVLIARSSRILEPYILEVVDTVVPEKGEIQLLEVGCGSGVYMRHACLRNPDLKAVGLEYQAEVAEFARKNLQSWGLAQQARVENEDIRRYASPECFDLVTLHNNIYYFPTAERLDLIRRLANFLNPGGKLVVTTACQGFEATQMLNLWGEMTAGTDALPQPDDIPELMRQSGFLSPLKIEILPGGGFYAFVGSKG